MVVSSNPFAATLTSDIAPVLSKEFLDIQATIECRFTLKSVEILMISANKQTWERTEKPIILKIEMTAKISPEL